MTLICVGLSSTVQQDILNGEAAMNDFLLIGVDIGGTFTDAVAVSATDIYLAKVPSDPNDPGQAVLGQAPSESAFLEEAAG